MRVKLLCSLDALYSNKEIMPYWIPNSIKGNDIATKSSQNETLNNSFRITYAKSARNKTIDYSLRILYANLKSYIDNLIKRKWQKRGTNNNNTKITSFVQ